MILPQFPVGEQQTLSNWLDTIKSMKEYVEDSIMIGHSLGVPFIMNVLNQTDKKIRTSFPVSGLQYILKYQESQI